METMEDKQHQQEPGEQLSTQHHTKSSGSNIRSRITVVCAECKRLKLRCDRRSPCASCVKRDTVDRCKYSQAATEKVDLQSVHNRVLALEAQMSALTSHRPVHRSYSEHNHTLLAIGSSGSSLAISLDDVTSVWLSNLDITPALKLTLETTPVELTMDNLPPAVLFPPISAFHASNSPTEPPSVTAQLMSRLPGSAQTRIHLLAALEDILALHPCFNFPHFKARIAEMFAWASEMHLNPLQDTYAASSSDHYSPTRPTLSFFAAASAGFALGALVNKTSDHPVAMMLLHDSGSTGPTLSSDPTCSPWALYALSEHALLVFEKTNNYDLDYVVAMILQVLFLLHGGKPRLPHVLFPLLGKMVNVARMMGLDNDPCQNSSTYPLFEAETRRRMWWNVFYYDLFVSDSMGQLPLISDNSFTTRLPADVDEKKFNPSCDSLPSADDTSSSSSVFLGVRCRLALLVKNLKRRDPEYGELSIEEAAELESKVAEFLADLPAQYQKDTTSPDGSLLFVQSSEIHIIANRLIITLYLPFLKASPLNPPHQASLATVNAAHKIIQTMRIWSLENSIGTGREKDKWASFGIYYQYRRMLFDAAVVCASMTINCPDSAFGQFIKEDINVALEIVKQMEASGDGTTSSFVTAAAGTLDGNITGGAGVLELLRQKVEEANVIPGGLKRKREEAKKDLLSPGFHIPYVGAGVSSAGSGGLITASSPSNSAPSAPSPIVKRPRSEPASAKVKTEATKIDPLDSRKRVKEHARKQDKAPEEQAGVKEKKGKEKASKHPAFGLRIRPGLTPPYVHSRTSTTSPSVVGSSNSGPTTNIITPTSSSDGMIALSRPSSPKQMPPPSSASRAQTPMDVATSQTIYYPGAENNSQIYATAFSPPNDHRMQAMSGEPRYEASRIAPTFFEQTYASQPTPALSQPSTSYASPESSASLQYSTPSEIGFYPGDYPYENSAGMGLGITGNSPMPYELSLAGGGPASPQAGGPFISSHSQVPMGMFTAQDNGISASHLGSTQFKGGGSNDMGIDPVRGQEWLKSAIAGSESTMGDTYFTRY